MPIVTVGPQDSRHLEDIAGLLAGGKKVVVFTGAGISTNCGIPDFRSVDGLYSLIQSKYEAVSASLSTKRGSIKGKDLFDSSLWKDRISTSVFYTFIASLRKKVQEVRGTSTTHKFIRTLRDRRKLVRCYTQNIDGLESREDLSMDLELGKGHRRRFTKKVVEVPEATANALPATRLDRGCEVVQLHGDLDMVRCRICCKTSQWGITEQESFINGHTPECHQCMQQDRDRRDRGMRGTAIGTLRPNIVLYGEEHPSADLLSPITTHDLGLAPDILLIMGTSLKVHGLKVLIKEFAKAVHQKKNGKVIFVNLTKPASSTWDGIIDYWVDMDCDAWIKDVRKRRPGLWQAQGVLDLKVAKTNIPIPKMLPKPKTVKRSLSEVEDEKENIVQSKYFSGFNKSTSPASEERPREALSTLGALESTVIIPSSKPSILPASKKRRIRNSSTPEVLNSNVIQAVSKPSISASSKKRPREALSNLEASNLDIICTTSENQLRPASKKRRVEASSARDVLTQNDFVTPKKPLTSPAFKKKPREKKSAPIATAKDLTRTPSKSRSQPQTPFQLPTPPSSRRTQAAKHPSPGIASTIRVEIPETPSRRRRLDITIWEDEQTGTLVEDGEYEGTTHRSPKHKANDEVQLMSPPRAALGAQNRATTRKLF
ncbi:MAG: hypothetical protein MMC33_005038 [Icmadophila ericetorum]|nr:hypothetical protein [Icmadophila ericetorum]